MSTRPGLLWDNSRVHSLGSGQAVRLLTLDQVIGGSNPPSPAAARDCCAITRFRRGEPLVGHHLIPERCPDSNVRPVTKKRIHRARPSSPLGKRPLMRVPADHLEIAPSAFVLEVVQVTAVSPAIVRGPRMPANVGCEVTHAAPRSDSL